MRRNLTREARGTPRQSAVRRPRRARAAALSVEIAWRLRASWGCEALLARVARTVALAEGLSRGTISIGVVGQRAMARLHEQFLGVSGPTDVITFDLRDPDATANHHDGAAASHVLGEIVVCADVARRQAAAPTRRAQVAELALYVTHGVLHLAGYDDHTPSAFARMHAREDELLNKLGLGRVFAANR